jgi:hypothetical protein
MSTGKHANSVRDFWWYDSIREIPDDGMGWRPQDAARSYQIRILQLRSTLHRIGTSTLQDDKSAEAILAEIRILAAMELLTLEKW